MHQRKQMRTNADNFPDQKISGTIHELFERQVTLFPHQYAVTCENQSLTYIELDQRANQLAHALIDRGIQPHEIVAIMLERSVEIIVSILAVLKAGACYLPIETNYPDTRIEFILKDSRPGAIITTSDLLFPSLHEGQFIYLDTHCTNDYPYTSPGIHVNESDLAYLIYTSGTTGQPKGVMAEHKGIVNLNSVWRDTFHIQPDDKIGLFASFAFDASIWEICMALFNGASLHILAQDIINNLPEFQNYLIHESITIMTLPPSYAIYLEPDLLTQLRLLITAGSASSQDLINKWNKTLTYINAYGPTEISICATIWIAPAHDCILTHIPVGTPVSNTQIYILDEDLQQVAFGELGELCVSGTGLARGYLHQPELTAQKFIDHPFQPGEKLYRTGDYAKWLPDGNLEYHGRMDHQVKINGYRIELGEIETALLKHEEITEAAVIVRTGKQVTPYLTALYTANHIISVDQLRSFLREILPPYMLPHTFYYLEQMPLTINGKIDRDMLGSMVRENRENMDQEQPQTDMEFLLLDIWRDVLGIQTIGIHDDFYRLGGDSIKAIQVAAKLHQYQLKLNIKDFLLNSTIHLLTSFVHPTERQMEQHLIEGEARLSPIQTWFFSKKWAAVDHWNQSVLLFTKGRYVPELLNKALSILVEHHDALRMIYRFDNELPLQWNRKMEKRLFHFDVYNISSESDEQQHIQTHIQTIQQSLSLSEGPLVAAAVFQTSHGDHFFLTIHHIVVDGVSYRILLEDLNGIYENLLAGEKIELPAKTSSYQTWTKYLVEYASSKELRNEIPYWSKLEADSQGLDTLPSLPTQNTHQNKKTVDLQWDPVQTQQLLTEVHNAYHTDINDLLLTALALSIHDWSGKQRVLLNLEGHGRQQELQGLNISRTVGWFTTQFPVVLNISSTSELSKQIIEVKEYLRKVPHKGVGYDILKYLSPVELRSRLFFNIQPEICFNYLGQLDHELNLSQFSPSPYSNGASLGAEGDSNIGENNTIIFPLSFTGYIQQGCLHFSISYPHGQYMPEAIHRLSGFFKQHLTTIIRHCMEKKEGERTASDFSHARLEQGELDKVYAMLEQSLKQK